MRLTTALALCVSVSYAVCLAQTNRISVSGYPAPQTIALSLDDAVKTAVERNLNLQIQRFNPVAMGYQVQAAYGAYYDPNFSMQWQRSDRSTEGAFNESLGFKSLPSSSQVDTTSARFGGNLPTGMRYSLYGDLAESRNRRPVTSVVTNITITNIVSGISETDDWSADAGIRVTQPLLRGSWIDQGRAQIQDRKLQKSIEDLRVEALAQGLVFDTVNAYYELLGALENVKVAEADLGFNDQLYNETRRRVEVGQRSALDEVKALAEVARTRTALVDARDLAADAEARLKGLLSDNYINQVNARLAPTEKLLLVPTMVDFPTSVRTALERKPSVLIARQEIERQNITLKYTYNQLFPSLDVFASWGVTGNDVHLGGSLDDLRKKRYENDSYGALLSFPLTMWQERNNHKAAKLTKEQLLLNLKATEEGTIKDVDDAIRAVVTNWELVALTRDQVRAGEADVDAQQKRYIAGKVTSLDVLDAQRNLTKARKDQIAAIVKYNVAQNRLSNAEGRALEEHKIDFETAHRLRRTNRP